MNYKNEKLNIKIENAEYLTIREFDDCVKLYDDNLLKFVLYNNSSAKLFNNSSAELYDNSSAKLFNNSSAVLYDNSSAELYSKSSAKLYYNSSAVLYDNSSAVLYDNSSAELYSKSSAVLYDFSVVWKKSVNTKIETHNHYGAIIEQVFKAKKKMLVYKKLENNLIATLELKRGQVFQSEHHNKCRTDSTKVIAIENIDGKTQYQEGFSQHDNAFVYKVGEVVSADYDDNIEECSSGIHFFLNRKSAERY